MFNFLLVSIIIANEVICEVLATFLFLLALLIKYNLNKSNKVQFK